MKGTDFLNQYSQAIELAERRITEFKEFNERYKLNDNQFFVERLVENGYDANELSTMLFNKDLMLTLYFNDFDMLEVDSIDTVIEIDIEIENARKQYMSAVDKANQSILAANDAKDMMLELKELIEKEYGYDSNNWDNKSIREMNEAIAVYNKLVEKANKDSEKCLIARQELAKVRKERSTSLVIENTGSSGCSMIDSENLVLEAS